MDLSPITIGIIAGTVAVPVVFGLLRKAESLTPQPKSTKSLQQLTSEYAKWEAFLIVPFLIFAPAIGILLWYTQKVLYGIFAPAHADSIYLLAPSDYIWALPAMLLALFLTVIPMHYLYLLLLGEERYWEYIEYSNLRHGVDGFKALKYAAYVLVPMCIAFSGLAMNSYVKITADKFVYNSIFMLEERAFAFDEITKIELTKSFKAPNGKVVRRPHYVISFINDHHYSFKSSTTDASIAQQEEVVSFLLENSDVMVEINDPYPRSP